MAVFQTEDILKTPLKIRARHAVQRAVWDGRLVRPSHCQNCGVECKPEGAHNDYTKPLEVEWLCHGCHMEKDRPEACPRGHEYTPENLIPRKTGRRQCRKCFRLTQNARRAELRKERRDG